MDDYTKLKKNVDEYWKNKFTYSAVGDQFSVNSITNLFVVASNPKTKKIALKTFEKTHWDGNTKDTQNKSEKNYA